MENSDLFEESFRKGIENFKAEKYLESNEDLKTALRLATSQEERNKLVIWTNKVEIELEENNLLPKPNDNLIPTNIKIIHSWYQNLTHIFLNLDSNTNLNKENFDYKIENKNLKILDKNNNIVWEMNLSNTINTKDSTVEVNGKKVEFKLRKEIDNFNWVTIDRSQVNQVQTNSKAQYPTSSKVKKDWDNVEKEINKELAEDAKSDPNEGMMRLFQEIYGNSNEETRRAMIKSFQTSGGTVLSTNWDEVKEKDYEGRDKPEPPKGQEWRSNNEK